MIPIPRVGRPEPPLGWWRLACATLVLALLAACAGPAAGPGRVLALGPGDHDKIARAVQGQVIEVRLPAAGINEARWDIDRLDAPVLVLLEPPSLEAPPAGAPPGTPPTAVFRFRAARGGQAMLRLVYRQPWLPAVKGDTFLAMVHVR